MRPASFRAARRGLALHRPRASVPGGRPGSEARLSDLVLALAAVIGLAALALSGLAGLR